MKNLLFVLSIVIFIPMITYAQINQIPTKDPVYGKLGKHKLIKEANQPQSDHVIGERIMINTVEYKAFLAYVNFAGNAHNLNEYHVQIQPINTHEGYSSGWPEWAYLLAKDAFLNGKKLWVIYTGDMPWGSNLAQVHLIN